ncbi:MAG TPA: LD-carboxypeptidase [Burkholderiaceae bacterium]
MPETPTGPFQDVGLAIVAPSGYATDEAAFLHALDKLAELGFRIHNYSDPKDKFQRFGQTDDVRLRQLQEATDNPDVQVVLCVRGGYGISRILPELDFKKMAASGKLFVGHSDFTPIHLGLLGAGATSFAGPFIFPDFTAEPLNAFAMEQFRHCLTSSTHEVAGQMEGNPDVDVSGVLWGGNLAMLTHLVGTPHLPQFEDGILFLEDIAEHPYRVERMLLQLLHAGILGKQKAVLLGDFSAYRLTDYDNGYDFNTMLAYIRERVGIPVIAGLPFGHVLQKATLAVGAQARLQSRNGAWELSMRDYRHL